MKRRGYVKLLALMLSVALAFCGCGRDAPEGTEAETTPLQEPTAPQEVEQYGYIAASADKVYEFPDDRPVFSLDNTFYSKPLLVELKVKEDAVIYYTTDGSEPDETDIRYDPDNPIYLGLERTEFPTALTIKARAFYPDGRQSAVAAHTYFCARNIEERFTTAVFAISGEPSVLTEGPDGIFYGENYNNRGDDTEREVFIEAWDRDGNRLFAQYSGIRIYGGASRASSIKSMKLYARKAYSSGIGKFDLDIFQTPVEDDSGKVVREYDKLVLRNCGNDFQFGFIRDELCQKLAMQAGFDDYEAVVPAVAYLNGEYYGLFWLHESYCDEYFKEKYPNKEAQGEFVVAEGSDNYKNEEEDDGKEVYSQEYNEFYRRYAQADLTNDGVYEGLRKYMDVENYLRYFAFNIYVNNWDWPQNNYKCYRYVPAEGEAFGGVYDGRWRYLLHDTDFSFHIYGNYDVAADYNNFLDILNPESYRYAPLFDALMHRADCREYFMAQLTALSEGALAGENVAKTMYAMHADRCTEMDYMYDHMAALRKAGDDSFWTSFYTMAENLNVIRAFANERDDYILYYARDALAKYE